MNIMKARQIKNRKRLVKKYTSIDIVEELKKKSFQENIIELRKDFDLISKKEVEARFLSGTLKE